MRTPLGALVGLTLLSAGCFYPAEKGQALQDRVDKLQANQKELIEQLKAERDMTARQMPALSQAISDLQARLDKLEHASRTSDADVGVQMEGVREDLAKLRGSVEEYQHRLELLDSGIKQLSSDTDQKFAALKGGDALKQIEANKKLASLKRPTDKAEFLKLADEQASSGSSEAAQALYTEFLSKWGKDPLAASAHLSLGKLYQDQSRCREALGEYRDVIEKFAKSDKAPAALSRSSDCFATLGMKEESKLALEELAKDYPNSQEGKQAKEKLKKGAAAPKKKGSK